jgi:hypothetical protein
MEHEEAKRRFKGLSPETQLRVLATFGHKLTIAARDTYEFQPPGFRAPQRLRDINEIQHRVLAHIFASATVDARRYPDDDLLSIVLEQGMSISSHKPLGVGRCSPTSGQLVPVDAGPG